MATTNVRLKDAAGNVLHPETDWSVVQNKPSISVEPAGTPPNETWDAGDRYMYIKTNQELSIRTPNNTLKINDSVSKNDVPLTDYPVKFSALSGKPSMSVDSVEESWSSPGTKRISSTGGSIEVDYNKGVILTSSLNTAIKVNDVNTNGQTVDLSAYPIKNTKMKMFGYVLGGPDSEDQQEVFPAVAIGCTDLGDLDTFQISTVVCMANNGAWTKLSVADNNKFISL